MTIPAAKVDHLAETGRLMGRIGNCPNPEGVLQYQPKLRLDVLDRLRYSSVLSAAQFDKDLLISDPELDQMTENQGSTVLMLHEGGEIRVLREGAVAESEILKSLR